MNKLFLIDGHALIFRMYYAFLQRPMVNTKGVDTSILFGFTKYILELIKREKATHIAVALDPPCKTFRHEMYPEYKGTRSATPELVKEAYEPIKSIIQALNIPLLIIEGYEADDVIGAMAKKCASPQTAVYMVTPDKDYGQLIGENIFQFKPARTGSGNEIYGIHEICEKYAIHEPRELIDILAIWGDTADNVPGVKGIGEVGAKKLVGKYGSVENILAHLDELTPKQAATFEASRENVLLSKKLVTIVTDLELQATLEDTRLQAPDYGKITRILKDLEMNSLIRLLPETESGAPDLFSQVSAQEQKKLDWKSVESISSLNLSASRICLRLDKDLLYISDGRHVFRSSDLEQVRSLLENPALLKIGYGLKEMIKYLKLKGIALQGELADIEIMHYLINPETTHQIEILSRSYLGIDLEAAGKKEDENIAPAQLDLFSQSEAASEADHSPQCAVLAPLYEAVLEDLKKDGHLLDLYRSIEMPLIQVLADMESEGFRIDTQMLNESCKTLTLKYTEIEEKIRELVEEPDLNVSSPKQLGIVLFEKLKLDPKVKKKASGSYTTDEETLTALKDRHPVIALILEFRALKKLVNTYIAPLPELIDSRTGNIHTTFNQALTATGRLSSSKPNLQNIPIRTELGKEIRKAFISSHPGGLIISADYSQIELRIMAALSEDPDLTEAFREGKDVHTATAAKIFKEKEEEVTADQRRQAKTANFGILYGISAFGLSQRLDIPRNEAKALIDEYFRHYKGVESFIQKMKEKAKAEGYVETLFHRKRFLPDINSRNQVVRGLAERNAVNAPIQGSAADIIKLAMIDVAGKIRERGLKSRMILQVHDELIFDVYPEEEAQILSLVKDGMENVVKLSIPLTVECNSGQNWLEAH